MKMKKDLIEKFRIIYKNAEGKVVFDQITILVPRLEKMKVGDSFEVIRLNK